MSAAETKAHNVTVPELLARVREIAPVLEQGARESEAERHLAAASVEALHEAGLFKLWWPEELGGPGASLAEGISIIDAVSEVDTASGWNLAVGTLTDGFAGAYLGDNAVEAMFATDRLVSAGQLAPIGMATRVDGGLLVSGHWSFGSGIHQSVWAAGGVMVKNESGGGEAAIVFAPIDQVQVDQQSWDVAGLSGTGSYDYKMTDLLIPDGFWCAFPAPCRLRGGRVFELPIPTQTIVLHGAFVLGAARRSLREITELAKTKMRAFSPGAVGGRATFQHDLAAAHAKLSAASLYVYDVARRTDQAAPADLPVLFLEGRAAARYATDVALDVATWAFRSGGGTALRMNSPLQRIVRDLLAASQHVFVDEIAYTGFGVRLLEAQP